MVLNCNSELLDRQLRRHVFEMADSKCRRHGAYEGRETVSMAFDRPEVYAHREKDENYSFYGSSSNPLKNSIERETGFLISNRHAL